MCGILACLGKQLPDNSVVFDENLTKLQHRGPDDKGKKHLVVENNHVVLGHTRLWIQGTSGSQPIVRDHTYLSANAEIYNAKQVLEKQYDPLDYTDCQAISFVLKQINQQTSTFELINQLGLLDGIYAFVYINVKENIAIVARSTCGVMNLFYGFDNEDRLWFGSERKALLHTKKINIFDPSRCLKLDLSKPIPTNIDNQLQRTDALFLKKPSLNVGLKEHLYMYLELAVAKRLKSVKDFSHIGFLLSGGLDSSAVIAIAKKIYPKKKIRTFCIGLDKNAPDMKIARQLAKDLDTDHKEYTFSIQEGIQTIPNVVKAIETIDKTTIRASTPMYLLIKKLKVDFPEIKVLLSGEGSDELMCGYLGFHNCPTVEAAYEWSTELMNNIHKFDVLRAHQCGMIHSVEIRVPFLDKYLMKYLRSVAFLSLVPMLGQEKYLLRQAMIHLLPPYIINRQKEQFSDGVGYQWIDTLRQGKYRKMVFDPKELTDGEDVEPEQLQIMDIFANIFGLNHLHDIETQMQQWTMRHTKTGDPSGRSSSKHFKSLL